MRRLAVAFWKGERAERMEVALIDGAPVMTNLPLLYLTAHAAWRTGSGRK